MKHPHPFRRIDRWYARNYVCPFWGHRIDNDTTWLDATKDGVLRIPGRVGNYCENCGEVVAVDDTRDIEV